MYQYILRNMTPAFSVIKVNNLINYRYILFMNTHTVYTQQQNCINLYIRTFREHYTKHPAITQTKDITQRVQPVQELEQRLLQGQQEVSLSASSGRHTRISQRHFVARHRPFFYLSHRTRWQRGFSEPRHLR